VRLPRSTIWLEVVVRVVFRLFPTGFRKALAGRPIKVDGQTLDPDLQLLLRLERLTSAGTPAVPLARRREHFDIAAAIAAGPLVPGVSTRPVGIRAGDRPGGRAAGDLGGADPDDLPARLYTPDGLPPGSRLLLFHHGGGWVTGSLTSHDALCRYLVVQAGVRVLAIDYRPAPEHPFPAAVDDMVAAFRFARAHAAELGADPARIALGGDSAGANLTVVPAHLAARAGTPVPPSCCCLGSRRAAPPGGPGARLRQHDRPVRAVPGGRGRGGRGAAGRTRVRGARRAGDGARRHRRAADGIRAVG
jgi:acetyl esterase/lipase